MNAKHSWLFLISLFFLSFNFASFASDGSEMSLMDGENSSLNSRCSYVYESWECERTRGCAWNYRGNYCYSNYDDDDDYRSCHNIYSPYECSNNPNCYWSRSQNRCVSNNGGGGGGSPRRCYYIRSPYECNNTYNCHWSRSFDRCVGPDDI